MFTEGREVLVLVLLPRLRSTRASRARRFSSAPAPWDIAPALSPALSPAFTGGTSTRTRRGYKLQ
eukprot:8479176-Heterocapsa_arctica.AAC.1